MTPTQLTVLLASLLVLSLVFLLLAFWLWRNKEHPRMSVGVFERDGESVMGEHLRDYKRRTTIHSIVNRLAGEAQPVKAVLSFIQREEFPDVSFYQGIIDWAKMATKTRKVIIRAGQRNWVDVKFIINWIGARLAGILRGVYWFYDGRESPGRQAQILKELIENDKPELGVWIDWERNFGGAHEGLKNVVAMMQEVERLLPGVKVGIYTGYWYFRENSNPIWNAAQYSYLALRGLWLAFYAALESVLIPAPWSRMTYWQKGTPSRGDEFGTEAIEIDINEDMAGDPPPVEEPEEPVTITFTGKIKDNTTGSRVRVNPDIIASVVTTLAAGTLWQAVGQKVTEDGYEWVNLVSPVNGWLALTSNVEWQPVTTPPPPAPAGEMRVKEVKLTIVIDGEEYVTTIPADAVLEKVD